MLSPVVSSARAWCSYSNLKRVRCPWSRILTTPSRSPKSLPVRRSSCATRSSAILSRCRRWLKYTGLFIMTNLPDRQFYLIGDSGEKDPEAYGEIRSKFSKLVKEIRIRDVVNADADKNDQIKYRLTGMVVRHAPTIVHGRSQFDS